MKPPLSRMENGGARDRSGPRTRAGAKSGSLVGVLGILAAGGARRDGDGLDEVVELVEGQHSC